MSKSVKALLLSALVLPGTGHFFLKKPIRGLILILASIVCIYVLTEKSLEIAQNVSNQLQAGKIPLNTAGLENAISKASSTNSGAMDLSIYVLEICWVIGVVDSFRIGKVQEKYDAIEAKRQKYKDLKLKDQ